MINPAFRAALGAMATIPQWFVWRMTWDAAEGKYQKVPVYADGTMRRHGEGANNPAYWMTLDAAAASVAVLPGVHTVGFWLSANTGYWFLDVDKCFATDGTCNDQGRWLYAALPGAFYERSSSDTGFHLIGRGVVPEHGTRDGRGLGLEFYTDGRGIAFNPKYAALGCADVDCSGPLLTEAVNFYFPKSVTLAAEGEVLGRVGPRDDWRGPTDDDELLRRAMRSHSDASLFNASRATFADLFMRDVEKLRLAYPDPTAVCGYGESEADSALAWHLAFWTGCDADRMERLMRRSALARPKWDEHRTYLRELTIRKACADKVGKAVLCDKPVALAEPDACVASTGPTKAVAVDINGQTFLSPSDQVQYFEGCVYVSDANAIYVPREGYFEMLSQRQFNVSFGGRSYVLDNDNGKTTTDAWEAFTQNRVKQFPKVVTTMFRPDMLPGSTDRHFGVPFVNTYVEPVVPRRHGDPSPFIEHLTKLLPAQRDRDILLSWMAALVQNPGVKFRWHPVLQGVPGNGKSTICDILQYAIGPQYVYRPKASELADKFNDWLYEKILIIVDDADSGDAGEREEFINNIRQMLSDERLEIQGKGVKKTMRNVCANFIMNMNRRDGIRKDETDRRMAIFFTAQQKPQDKARDMMDGAYFVMLNRWLKQQHGFEIVAQFLRDYEIHPQFNPVENCVEAPDTSTTAEVFAAGRGLIDEILAEAVTAGQRGFRDGWISYKRLKLLISDNYNGRIKPSKIEQILDAAGYIAHPGLALGKGWTNNGLMMEGGEKDRLYVIRNHATLAQPSLTNSQLTKIYEHSQLNMEVTN